MDFWSRRIEYNPSQLNFNWPNSNWFHTARALPSQMQPRTTPGGHPLPDLRATLSLLPPKMNMGMKRVMMVSRGLGPLNSEHAMQCYDNPHLYCTGLLGPHLSDRCMWMRHCSWLITLSPSDSAAAELCHETTHGMTSKPLREQKGRDAEKAERSKH